MYRLTPLVLILGTSIAAAEAPVGFSYKEIPSCSEERDAYTSPDLLKVYRSKNIVVVTALASLNCGSSVRPSVTYGRGVVSINIEEFNAKGAPIAGCNCMRSFRFELTEKVKPKTAIYLVNGGQGSAHAVAP